MNEFEKFAISQGVNPNTLNGYIKSMNTVSPTVIEERSNNVATMDIFSRLMQDRIIFLGAPITSEVANIVTSQLMFLDMVDEEKDIKLFINSPGGSIDDGLAIYDVMNWVNSDVATYTIGMAASMASVLLSSGTKGKRYALPHSRVMIHQVSGWAGGPFADMKIWTDEMKKSQNDLYKILSENTGKSIEQIEADADRDHWFNAQEALDYGIIDKIMYRK